MRIDFLAINASGAQKCSKDPDPDQVSARRHSNWKSREKISRFSRTNAQESRLGEVWAQRGLHRQAASYKQNDADRTQCGWMAAGTAESWMVSMSVRVLSHSRSVRQ